MEIFSTRMISLRKTKGLTQQEMANIFHKSRQAISSYETQEREPEFNFLCKMANYFHVSTDYLLGISDVMEPKNEATTEEQILLSALRKASKRDAAIIWKLLEPYITSSEKRNIHYFNLKNSEAEENK
jgi:immunity repressor protein